ncbi:DUF2934 domain-containing protein [Rhodoferax sp.]|uniref:DUF2934 domain-containing protein n=1 Tax=Rhodoferax sp. TaxID=50421 RepID=UPI0026119F2C|nr:DUF2934 domain-containing protein [Rhodoferax sp.]MDD2808450.1 DUF2934 domain-containing protein [Rhodoferax sp.]MDD4944706.1 DUF2934 domain-containing protein [Rhodoferax sp.]
MVTAKKTSTPKPAAKKADAAAPEAKSVAAQPVAAKKTAKATVTSPAVAAPAKAKTSTKTAAKAAVKPKADSKSTPALSPEQRQHYVEVAAFYIAERRGFAPGNPAEDWAAAEVEVDRLIASGHFN